MNDKKVVLDVIGVGMPRCGTTWLMRCLSEHPEICVSDEKELHFFDVDYGYVDMFSMLNDRFGSCDSGALKIEFTTDYTRSLKILNRIKDNFPSAKILFVVRNPYDRTFSHYLYRKRKNGLPRKMSDLFKKDPKGILDSSLYGKHFERVLKVFDRENIIILNHDDARKDALKYIQNAYKQLGVDSSFVPPSLNLEVNRSKNLLYKVPVFEWVFTYRMKIRKNFFGRLFIKIAKFIKLHDLLVFLRNKNIKTLKNNKETEVLSDTDREKLKEYFRKDILKFERQTGIDFSTWK